MTADYWFYKRVRLEGEYEWQEPVYGVFETEMRFLEVPA